MDLDLDFEYSIEEKNKKILKTCVNILIYRNLLNKDKYKEYIKELLNNYSDDETYIKLNNDKYFSNSTRKSFIWMEFFGPGT